MGKTVYTSEYWAYQMRMCRYAPRPIVNIGSNEDPAHLGHLFGAVNLDVIAEDPATHQDLYRVPRFVQGTALALPFHDAAFGAAVLGEVLEHCKPESALAILREAHRVLKAGAWLIATVPFDIRPPEDQHPDMSIPEAQRFYTEDITYYHQTVWNEPWLRSVTNEAGFDWHSSRPMQYPLCECDGLGFLVKKKEES